MFHISNKTEINSLTKVIILFTIIITVPLYCFAQNNEIVFMFSNDNQKEFYKKYFEIKSVNYYESTKCIKTNYDVELLTEIVQIELLKIDIIRNNIVNRTTTRKETGEHFVRKYVAISDDSKIIIRNDTETEEILRYEPQHPDAIKEGFRCGYVIYPNVDLTKEYSDLEASIQFYNGIVDYIQRNNIEIAVEKIIANRIDLSIKKEYILLLQNIANANTNGYKSHHSYIDFSQGMIKKTNRALDFAIDGDGFFELILEDGTIVYTRNGEFTIDTETNELIPIYAGKLSNTIIIKPGFVELIITKDHAIITKYQDGEEVHNGYLYIYKLDNNELKHPTNNFFSYLPLFSSNTENYFLYSGSLKERIYSGIFNNFLEVSNVDLVIEIVRLLEISDLPAMGMNWFED